MDFVGQTSLRQNAVGPKILCKKLPNEKSYL